MDVIRDRAIVELNQNNVKVLETNLEATGDRFKMMAKATMEQATAAAKRLQMSADNVADSYARSMRLVASTPIPAKVEKKTKEKPVKKAKKAKAKKAK